MLTKIKEFVKKYQNDIILLIGVILISLLSFAMGYIVAKEAEKEPLRIELIPCEFRCEFYANYMRIYDSYVRSDS